MHNSEAALRIACEQDAPYRFWVDGLGESAREKRSIEKDLADAIEHDQLELHLQPLVDGGTGEIQGMEALARWRRPGYGWVPPLEFFAVAQSCGLLEVLEEWVLRRAASIHSNWRRRGIPRGRLFMNCVPSFLARPSFAPMVLSILNLQGLDGSSVEFEVAKKLGLDLSAEGVETAAQRDFLLESGCRVMQGFFFARPMTPLDAAVLLRRGSVGS